MPRPRKSGLGILLQGKLPRGVDQSPQPAGPGHEAEGQRGKERLCGFGGNYGERKRMEEG